MTYPWEKKEPTWQEQVIKDYRAGYLHEMVAAGANMLPEELDQARKDDPDFDRLCKIAEMYGMRQDFDTARSTTAGAVKVFQRKELRTWAPKTEPIAVRCIEDYIE